MIVNTRLAVGLEVIWHEHHRYIDVTQLLCLKIQRKNIFLNDVISFFNLDLDLKIQRDEYIFTNNFHFVSNFDKMCSNEYYNEHSDVINGV